MTDEQIQTLYSLAEKASRSKKLRSIVEKDDFMQDVWMDALTYKSKMELFDSFEAFSRSIIFYAVKKALHSWKKHYHNGQKIYIPQQITPFIEETVEDIRSFDDMSEVLTRLDKDLFIDRNKKTLDPLDIHIINSILEGSTFADIARNLKVSRQGIQKRATRMFKGNK